MLVKVPSALNLGLQTLAMEVEVNVANRGLPAFEIVGLPTKAVAESKERVKTAAVNDMLDIKQKESSSDLVKAMDILRNNENLESNTILNNLQVNGLSLMNWAAQVYEIEFFKHYVATYPKYRISGDDGRGRKELIQIAEAIQRSEALKQEKMLEMLGLRR